MPPADPPRPPGRLAYAWLAVTAGAAVALAVAVVPWDWLPAGTSAPVDPTAGLSTETLAEIDAYRDRVVPLSLAAYAVSVGTAVLLALTPWGARLVRNLPGRRWWPLHLVVSVLVLVVLGRLVTLPFTVPAEVATRNAGLSTLSWPGWTLDVGRGVLVDTVATSVALLALVGLARWGRRGWWLAASWLAGLLVLFGSYVFPLVVEPLFNSFEPMSDGSLRTSLVRLAEEDGIQVDDVLVADASRRTTAVNAYVSGFGSTRRIVVYDTLLREASPAEVRLVVAHELGHAEAGDVLTGTVLGALAAMAGVTGLVLVAGSGTVRRRAGIDGLHRIESVPLVLGLAALVMLMSLPEQNVISRAIEARADVHALELTGDVTTFDRMQRRFSTSNLTDPDPPRWLYVWFASHPTPAERIALAAGWTNREQAGHGSDSLHLPPPAARHLVG